MRSPYAALLAAAAVVAGLSSGASASTASRPWHSDVAFANRVVSSPARSGGYPTPTGDYVPGTCRAGSYDANFAESALAVRPGTEHLVGASKFFFERFSTYYNFTTGSFDITANSSRSNVIDGYDCTMTGTQASPPTWTSTTDPNLAFDTKGRVHDIVLAFNWYRLDGDVYASHSDDNGRHWVKGNAGRPVEAGPVDAANGEYLDKPWVAVNTVRGHRWADHVYAVWAVRRDNSSAIHVAVSRDRGASYTAPIRVPTPQHLGSTNPWPYISVDAQGDVYVVYAVYAANGSAQFWTARSRDDGRSWTAFRPAGPRTRVDLADAYPGTRVHVGAPESFTASPDRPGHLYLAWEEQRGGRLGIRLSTSADGGRTWSAAREVNDDSSATDQVQPVVAAGPRGAVAVAFYDKRLACPRDASVLPANRGRPNTCFSLSLQPLRDVGAAVLPVGGNRRISARPWDPEQPGQRRGGLGQLACDAFDDPCSDIFIGDYFGLVVTERRVYAMSVSTAEPSRVQSDAGGPIYYQQQVLATVDRADLGF